MSKKRRASRAAGATASDGGAWAAWTALAAFAALAAVVYGGVLDAPFVFDDAKFLNEPLLQVHSAPQLLTLLAAKGQPRKVGLATFALNHLAAGRFEPMAVRAASLALHVANALLLLLLLRALLRTQGAGRRPRDWALAAGAAVWLVHPVQTQAVAYAWQRFTPLCAFFYVLSLWSLLQARDSTPGRRAAWISLALLSAALALGAKENAGMLPLAALLLLALIRPAPGPPLGRNLLLGAAAAGLLAAAIAFFYLGPHWWEITRDSLRRGFTPWQRVLTEWGVIVYYVTLLPWPHPARLNLDYEWPVSTGLLSPPSTLLALLLIVLVLAGALAQSKRRPLVTLTVLWFFGNLAIESTFIPLDLVFEHRLYLPSMLPLALGTAWALDAIPHRRWAAAAAALLVGLLAFWSWQRNQVWKDPVALWEDTARKSPNKARPHWNLGKAYFMRGDYERARKPTERALELEPGLTGALNNLATIEIAQGRLENARVLLERGLGQEPEHVSLLTNLGIVLMRLGRNQEAITPLEKALAIEPDGETLLAALVAAHYGTANYARAVAVAREGIARQPRSARLHAFLGAALAQSGMRQEARQALEQALHLDPRQPLARDALARLR